MFTCTSILTRSLSLLYIFYIFFVFILKMKCSHYHHQFQPNTSEFHFLFPIFNFITPFSTMINLAFLVFNLLTYLISLSACNQSLSPQRSPPLCRCPSPFSTLTPMPGHHSTGMPASSLSESSTESEVPHLHSVCAYFLCGVLFPSSAFILLSSQSELMVCFTNLFKE